MGKTIWKEYKRGFKYLSKSWKYILVSVVVFLIFLIIGIFVPAPESVSSQIFIYLEQLLSQTEGYCFGEMFLFIFFNNFKSSFFGLFAGVIFGIFSLFTSLINGYLLGFVSNFVSSQEGAGVLWRLVPHGIFELPAVFISLGLGLKLGSFFVRKKKIEFIKINLRESLGVFVMIVIPLLIVAAIIESALIVIG